MLINLGNCVQKPNECNTVWWIVISNTLTHSVIPQVQCFFVLLTVHEREIGP